MHRRDLLNYLCSYRTRFMDEAAYVRRAITYIENNPDCFEREHTPVHVTGSAWVVNPDRSCVLLVLHGTLHEWYQPGGHADGDPNVLRVAMREATEESGVDDIHVRLVSPEVFDVDMHMIPALPKAPAHGHIDIRFLLEIDDVHDLPGSHESRAVKWVGLHRVLSYNSNRSTYRMVEKTRQMRRRAAVSS